MQSLLLTLLLALAGTSGFASAEPSAEEPGPGVLPRLPLLFEANGGAYHESVGFVAHGPGYTLMLTPGGTSLLLESSVTEERGSLPLTRPVHVAALRTTFVGGRSDAAMTGVEPAPTLIHHIRGNDPEAWSVDNPTFTRVRYDQVWPGVDAVFYDADGQLEYDFVVAPGADPSVVRLAYEGADRLSLRDDGALVLHTPAGELVNSAPVLYQHTGESREPVTGRFVLHGGDEVGFAVDDWDTARPLVIDPVMVYASTFGGTMADYNYDLAVDAQGRAHLVGETLSADLPWTFGAYDATLNDTDAYVARLSADGTALDWCTYLGGSNPTWPYNAGGDRAFTVEVDDAGLVYVAGSSESTDFPTLSDALKQTQAWYFDAFVSVLSSDGSALQYSTLLGGTLGDTAYDLCVTDAGRVYLTGETDSGFPVTPVTYDSVGTPRDAFVAWFTPGGPLEYGSHLGGPAAYDRGHAIEVDDQGRVYVAGTTLSHDFPTSMGGYQQAFQGNADGFLCRFDPTGQVLQYGTMLGGSGSDMDDTDVDIAIADDGRVWIAGASKSSSYPTSAGAHQATNPTDNGVSSSGVLTCLDTDVSGAAGMVFSTYFGSGGSSGLSDVEVDASGNAWVFGYTIDADFPTLLAWDDEFNTGTTPYSDALLACFDAAGTLLNASYVGGSGAEPNTFAPQGRGGLERGPGGDLYVSHDMSSGNQGLSTPGAYTSPTAGVHESWVARFKPDAPVCQFDYGYDGPGTGTLSVCGGDLSTGTFGVLRLSDFAPNKPVILLAGLAANPTYVGDISATLVPVPVDLIVILSTDSDGEVELYVPGWLGPVTVFLQGTQADNPGPGQWTTSNAVEVEFLP